jgi:hypothetical protein
LKHRRHTRGTRVGEQLKVKNALACGLVSALLLGGAGQAIAAESSTLNSERSGIGLEEVPQKAGMVSLQALALDARRSLAVTEKTILSQFTLKAHQPVHRAAVAAARVRAQASVPHRYHVHAEAHAHDGEDQPRGQPLQPRQLIPVSSHKWGIARIDAGTTLVHQKGRKTFTFAVTAPTAPGTYSFQWRMARNGVGFGTSTPLVNITVK